MNIKQPTLMLSLILNFVGLISLGQTKFCDEIDKELLLIDFRLFPFYYGNQDSLNYYSDLFSDKLIDYIRRYILKAIHNRILEMIIAFQI